MKKYTNIAFFAALLLGGTFFLESCGPAGGNNTGHEYMMDMGHSIAYEANTVDLFYYNRWDMNSYLKYAQPRSPIPGTIPRGYVGLAKSLIQFKVNLTMKQSMVQFLIIMQILMMTDYVL